MKVLCSACKQLADIAGYRADQGGQLWIRCGSCGHESSAQGLGGAEPAPPAPASSSADWLAPPPGYCAKCISPRADQAESCPKCGLVFERLDAEALAPAEWLVQAWQQVMQAWHEEARHRDLLLLADQQGALAPLGRLYRVRLAWAPGDAMAEFGRSEVLRLGTARPLHVGETQARPAAKKWGALLGAALLFGTLAVVAIAGIAR